MISSRPFVCTVLAAALLFSPTFAFALPGEAAAVLAHCGAPASDYQAISPVTSQIERNLTYGGVIMHFDRTGGGWSYRSAWYGHTPISEAHVSRLMPCFSDALQQVAAGPAISAVDPGTAPDGSTAPVGIRFNRTFLILLFVLVGILLVSVAAPATRRRRASVLPMEARPFRKPRALGFRFRKIRRVPKPVA